MLLPLLTLSQPKHLDTAKSYVGITELTGKNDGVVVEKFLKSVGRRRGDSWCAAFVSYCLSVNKVRDPLTRSGLARSFKNNKKLILAVDVVRGIKQIKPGYLIGWEKGNTIFGHIGFVYKDWNNVTGKTIEGNTSSGESGSQSNGDGVYIRTRKIQLANYFAIKWFVPVL